MDAKDQVVRDLLAERYAKPLWWSKPEPVEDDDEIAAAQRRRLMAADFDAITKGELGAS